MQIWYMFCIGLLTLGKLIHQITATDYDCSALDIIFLVDSSGSAYDSTYTNWALELDVINFVVSTAIPDNTRVSVINFSGCSPIYDFESCKDYPRLIKEFGLETYGLDHISTINNINKMYNGSSYFLRGYTWTDEALLIAYNEFINNTIEGRDKMIVIITDGEPTSGHEPCESDTFKSIRNFDISIVAIAVDATSSISNSFFTCMVIDNPNYFFDVDGFNNLANASLLSSINQIIINEYHKVCTKDKTTIQPTSETTKTPNVETTQTPLSVPTTSETKTIGNDHNYNDTIQAPQIPETTIKINVEDTNDGGDDSGDSDDGDDGDDGDDDNYVPIKSDGVQRKFDILNLVMICIVLRLVF